MMVYGRRACVLLTVSVSSSFTTSVSQEPHERPVLIFELQMMLLEGVDVQAG